MVMVDYWEYDEDFDISDEPYSFRYYGKIVEEHLNYFVFEEDDDIQIILPKAIITYDHAGRRFVYQKIYNKIKVSQITGDAFKCFD
jgi:hypothetical protein